MSNAEMEKNRQIVQDGLNKRASKRKQSIREAEQEAYTVQMFAIINANACRTIPHIPTMHMESPVYKATKKPSKRTVMLRNISAVNFIISIAALIISIVLYATHLMDLICMIATSIVPVFMLILNLCIFISVQKKLKRRV